MEANGVKPRYDKKGDQWAAMHRNLGPTFNMHDVDAVMGHVSFAENTGDRFFLEYVPDSYQNRYDRVRKFGAVAFFDRKSSLEFALSAKNTLSISFYLWLARAAAVEQPVAPLFFFVVGEQRPPWSLHEVDIYTGELTGKSAMVGAGSWSAMWSNLGICAVRDQLRRWIDPPAFTVPF